MKTLISGKSGFVNSNLSRYLINRGWNVESFTMRDDSWKEFLDQNDDADAIIHLAGKAHDTANTSDPSEYFYVNRDLTISLFEHFIRSGIRDFFYFSSVKAVADTVSGVLFENVTPNPKTPYGKSKWEAEQYLMSQKLPAGKRLFIIRPCMIHGPGNKGNLNLLYNIVKKGLPWPLADFYNRRSFLSVDNLSFLIEKMIQNRELTSGLFNFADDETISSNDLVKLIGVCVGKRTTLLRVPAGLIRILVKIGDILPLSLNSERLKKLTESYEVSNKKIKKAIGIEKLPLTVKEGLKITIKSFG